MKLHLKLAIAAGSIFILLALTVLSLVIYYDHRSTAKGLTPVAVEPTTVKATAIIGNPVRLLIPSLNMNLKVADGVQNTQTGAWTLSTDKVHYALMTAKPNNDNGNTLIYGHYRREVFSNLKSVKPGAKAAVITDNGYKFIYVYKSNKIVAPTDGSIFKYKGEPQLTLQTCTGTFFQNRQLFDFDFVRVEKV